mmetsp:Transcript_45251/g.141843  ORF Transcript_45251/g.141843 Transcript_45251/m.141843 type:complete len:233 (+) Transcript_45251:1282-1980(+)
MQKANAREAGPVLEAVVGQVRQLDEQAVLLNVVHDHAEVHNNEQQPREVDKAAIILLAGLGAHEGRLRLLVHGPRRRVRGRIEGPLRRHRRLGERLGCPPGERRLREVCDLAELPPQPRLRLRLDVLGRFPRIGDLQRGQAERARAGVLFLGLGVGLVDGVLQRLEPERRVFGRRRRRAHDETAFVRDHVLLVGEAHAEGVELAILLRALVLHDAVAQLPRVERGTLPAVLR